MNQINLEALKQNCFLEEKGYCLINYINLSVKDSREILRLRNHSSIRERMVDSGIISEENHFNFILSLKEKNAGYWVLKKENIILGSISLVGYDKKENSFIGGNFISPELIGTGFGVVINYFMHLLAFETVKCNKIKAFVKNSNLNALKINTFFGAARIDAKYIKADVSSDYTAIEFLSLGWRREVKGKAKKMIQYVL